MVEVIPDENVGVDMRKPRKSVVQDTEVTVNCQVKFINFEGRLVGPKQIHTLQIMRPHRIVCCLSCYQIENISWLKR